MNVALRRGMTPEEFLDWQDGQEGRWEFDGFRPVAMVGGTRAHSQITVRLLSALFDRLRGSPWQVFNDTLAISPGRSVRYPDAFVSGSPGLPSSKVAEEPIVVFEVLSPSTPSHDVVVKNSEYRAMPSIQRYVILSQEQIGATVFERRGTEWVNSTLSGPEAVLEMPEIGVSVPLADLYEGVIEAT